MLQLESERITHEQATQAIEERFAKLSETFTEAVEEKRQIQGQMAAAQAEVASLKARAGKQELELTEKLRRSRALSCRCVSFGLTSNLSFRSSINAPWTSLSVRRPSKGTLRGSPPSCRSVPS